MNWLRVLYQNWLQGFHSLDSGSSLWQVWGFWMQSRLVLHPVAVLLLNLWLKHWSAELCDSRCWNRVTCCPYPRLPGSHGNIVLLVDLADMDLSHCWSFSEVLIAWSMCWRSCLGDWASQESFLGSLINWHLHQDLVHPWTISVQRMIPPWVWTGASVHSVSGSCFLWSVGRLESCSHTLPLPCLWRSHHLQWLYLLAHHCRLHQASSGTHHWWPLISLEVLSIHICHLVITWESGFNLTCQNHFFMLTMLKYCMQGNFVVSSSTDWVWYSSLIKASFNIMESRHTLILLAGMSGLLPF